MQGLKTSLNILMRVLSSLAAHADGDRITDQKIRFFYESAELSGLRVKILGNLCISHAQ
jgi:hypothetical protein